MKLLRRYAPRNEKSPFSRNCERVEESRGNLKRYVGTFSMTPQPPINGWILLGAFINFLLRHRRCWRRQVVRNFPWDALWYAQDEGNTEIVEMLRKHEAKEDKSPESAPQGRGVVRS